MSSTHVRVSVGDVKIAIKALDQMAIFLSQDEFKASQCASAAARLRRRVEVAEQVRVQNPPIEGHHLLNEGLMWRERESTRIFDWPFDSTTVLLGGCQCGAQPETMVEGADGNSYEALPSTNAVKRWHRAHKDEIRRQMAADGEDA